MHFFPYWLINKHEMWPKLLAYLCGYATFFFRISYSYINSHYTCRNIFLKKTVFIPSYAHNYLPAPQVPILPALCWEISPCIFLVLINAYIYTEIHRQVFVYLYICLILLLKLWGFFNKSTS